MRTICQRFLICRLRRNMMNIKSGMMHMEMSVSFQLTTNMMTNSSTSVKHSISTFTMPLVNRSLSALTSFMTRTRILPALRVSKKEKDSVCM